MYILVIIFAGIIIYAGYLDWAAERKMFREDRRWRRWPL